MLVADGALSQRTSVMVARRDRGVAGIVMSTRLPFTTPDYLHDKRFAHEPTLDDTFREEGIAALVGVPLIWEGEVTGLLFVADRYHRTHTAQSTSILCTLATYGAVALKNARDFERVTAALAKADQARAELEHHLLGIQAATDAHEQITSLLARGASLATLCESVARLLGGSVLVLDETGVVVGGGTAPGYAGSASADYSANDEHGADLARAARASRANGRSVVAYEVDGETCRALPVIGGDDILGTALLFHRGALADLAVRTFERSCSVIGIVLLSQHRAEASRNRGASALLRSLVSPRQDDPAVLADRAAQHGLDLTRPLSLLVVEMDSPRADYAARRFGMIAPPANALADDIDGALVVLCGASGAHEVRQALATWVRQELKAVHRGVLSRPVAAAGGDPGALRDAAARAGGARPDRRAGTDRRPGRAGDLLDAVRDPRPDQPRQLPRGDDRPADRARRQARLRPRGDAARLLRQPPERQDGGAAHGHPRQHRAPAAGDDRRPARRMGPRVARARDPHRAALVEPEHAVSPA